MLGIVFLVEEASDVGLAACALGESISTQADSIQALREEGATRSAGILEEAQARPSSGCTASGMKCLQHGFRAPRMRRS